MLVLFPLSGYVSIEIVAGRLRFTQGTDTLTFYN
jgi:hypothetical protein